MIQYSDDYWKEVRQVLNRVPDVAELFGKSILITGATGMICSAVVELLLELNKSHDARISVFLAGRNRERLQARFTPFVEGKDFCFVEYDATKEGEISLSPDYIIHGASPADPASFSKYPVETMSANLYGLKTLLDIAKKKSRNTAAIYIVK